MLAKMPGRYSAIVPLAAIACFLLGRTANAQVRDLGEIATGLTAQAGSLGTLLSVFSFVLGLGMALGGLWKFREHSKSPNDPGNKVSTAFVLILAGSGMVAIPEVLGTGVATLFGEGAQVTNGTSGFSALN